MTLIEYPGNNKIASTLTLIFFRKFNRGAGMVDVFFGVAGIKSESANNDLRKKQK